MSDWPDLTPSIRGAQRAGRRLRGDEEGATGAENARRMLADDGVGVTLIDPGAVETNLFDADGRPYARGLARLTTPSALTI